MAQDHNTVIAVLCEVFPRTFFENPRLRQPIKKGILNDIEAQRPKELNGYDVASAIEWYCHHYAYLKSVSLAGSRRLDLEGNYNGTVTPAEAQSAIEEINEINARKNAMALRNPHSEPLRDIGTVMQKRVNGVVTMKPSSPPLTDDQIATAAQKKLGRVAAMLEDDDDSDGLRGMLLRPLLESLAEDVRSLIARTG